jgi:hypothetical protein
MYDVKDCINSKEDTYESKHVNTYRQQIQNVPITLFFVVKDFFLKQLKIVTNKLAHFYKLK